MQSSLITQDRMEQAILYLCSTDEEIARAKALVNGLKENIKTVKALAYNRSLSGVVAQREHDAFASEAYRTHLTKIQDAEYVYTLLQARRDTETVIIECWRSLNAARTKGL